MKSESGTKRNNEENIPTAGAAGNTRHIQTLFNDSTGFDDDLLVGFRMIYILQNISSLVQKQPSVWSALLRDFAGQNVE